MFVYIAGQIQKPTRAYDYDVHTDQATGRYRPETDDGENAKNRNTFKPGRIHLVLSVKMSLTKSVHDNEVFNRKSKPLS